MSVFESKFARQKSKPREVASTRFSVQKKKSIYDNNKKHQKECDPIKKLKDTNISCDVFSYKKNSAIPVLTKSYKRRLAEVHSKINDGCVPKKNKKNAKPKFKSLTQQLSNYCDLLAEPQKAPKFLVKGESLKETEKVPIHFVEEVLISEDEDIQDYDFANIIFRKNYKVKSEANLICKKISLMENPSLMMLPLMSVHFKSDSTIIPDIRENARDIIMKTSLLLKPVTTVDVGVSASFASFTTAFDGVDEDEQVLDEILDNIDTSCSAAEMLTTNSTSALIDAAECFENNCKTSDAVVEIILEKMKFNTLCTTIDDVLNNIQGLSNDGMWKKALKYEDFKLQQPIIIDDIRRIGPMSILVKWTLPEKHKVIGFEILVDGFVRSRILSAERQQAILDGLSLKSKLIIMIYAMSDVGRCNPPSIAEYEMI